MFSFKVVICTTCFSLALFRVSIPGWRVQSSVNVSDVSWFIFRAFIECCGFALLPGFRWALSFPAFWSQLYLIASCLVFEFVWTSAPPEQKGQLFTVKEAKNSLWTVFIIRKQKRIFPKKVKWGSAHIVDRSFPTSEHPWVQKPGGKLEDH